MFIAIRPNVQENVYTAVFLSYTSQKYYPQQFHIFPRDLQLLSCANICR
jgi:hypothetical protein